MSRWLRKITPTSVGAVDQVGAFLLGGLPVFRNSPGGIGPEGRDVSCASPLGAARHTPERHARWSRIPHEFDLFPRKAVRNVDEIGKSAFESKRLGSCAADGFHGSHILLPYARK